MLREVVAIVDGDAADALSDAALAAGALSVAVEDADADADGEQPLYGEPDLTPARPAWRRNRLLVLVDSAADAAALLAAAAAAIGHPAPAIVATRDVAEADWVRLTQSQFAPVCIGERLWIVPTWHELPDPSAINIRLDPGAAFGTGAHPTTRLCLQWLAQADLAGARVLDYGCGSGILAIAAAKLGAREVVGTDIDEQALQAARANSDMNSVAARYTASHELGADAFDVILANILAQPLQILAPLLTARLADRGRLVLSGVLDRQAQLLIDAYARVAPDLVLSVWRREDGWCCIAGARTP